MAGWAQSVPLFWVKSSLAVGGDLPSPGLSLGKALAQAAGPGLATLEGKITIITIPAGPRARSRARIVPGKSRPARGVHTGALGPPGTFWGRLGLGLGGLLVCWVTGETEARAGRVRGTGIGGEGDKRRPPITSPRPRGGTKLCPPQSLDSAPPPPRYRNLAGFILVRREEQSRAGNGDWAPPPCAKAPHQGFWGD